MKKLAYLIAPLLLAACPDVKLDPGEGNTLGATDGPTVEFDPANSIIPFPNNLLFGANGKVNLPMQCNEGPSATALREGVINKLDGFGAFETGIQITFTAPVDPTTLTDHIVMLQRTNGPDALTPGTPVAVNMIPGTTVRYDATCTTPSTINSLTIIPKAPLDQKSTYVVAVLDGVKTATGAAFLPSFTWALVRQKEEPVGVDAMGNITANHTPIDATTDAGKTQIKGIDLLWNAHAKAMAFLAAAGHDETTVDLAFEFTTQTVTDTLDPTVVGSPANAIVAMVPPVIPDVRGDAQTVLHGAYTALFGSDQCQQPYTNMAGTSFPGGGLVPCQAVGHIDAALIISPQYQTDTPNPLAGGNPVPGPFNDPIKPTVIHAAYQLQAVVVIPDPAVVGPMPAGGWPTLVFGHGLGSSKESAVVIASALANAGFQAIGIDFVAHGSRAILVDNKAADGCDPSVNSGTGPDPTVDHQCFAPPLSVDLGTTRDNIRQTVLDLQQVVATLKACGPTGGCGNLIADPSRIVYMGISLGGIIGSTTVAADPDIKEAVLNVAAVGLADILENSQTNDIRCPLVDALIGAGILTGAVSNLSATPPTGLCTTSDWSKQAGYAQFAAIARWALDPCDGANFTPKLAGRKFLLQEVVGDQVVPNIATDDEGALTGLSPMIADMFTGTEPASAAITSNFPHNTWVRYPTLPMAGAFPGNAFQHASLLSPVPSVAGFLGTARVQTDAITFLSLNK